MIKRLSGSFSERRNSRGSVGSNGYPRRSGSCGSDDKRLEPIPDGGILNGFATTADIETFNISEKYIAPFSLPQEALSFEPEPPVVVHTFKNGDRERKLHLNRELRDDEMKLLLQLQEKARAAGVAFMPALTVVATRYISQARGNVDLAFTLMQRTQEWRLEYFNEPLPEASILEDMKYGIAYFSGRDRCLRPALVFRASRIPQEWHKAKNYDRVMAVVIFCIEYFLRYMVVPGRVEGINIVCDLSDMGLSQVPVSALIEMHKSMGSHYTGRVFKFYICNMSWVLKSLVSVAKGILSDRQNQKLVFVNKKEELRQDFALHQLETDLGGSMPIVKEFLPFPLKAGPFDAGYSGGPDAGRVPNVHKALTKLGHRGRLWDTSKSQFENTRLEYTRAAEDILTKCALPIPPECPRRPKEEPKSDTRKEDEARKEEARREEARREEARREEARREEVRQEEARKMEARKEEVRKEEANQESKRWKTPATRGVNVIQEPALPTAKEKARPVGEEFVIPADQRGGGTTSIEDADDVVQDAKVKPSLPFFCCASKPCCSK